MDIFAQQLAWTESLSNNTVHTVFLGREKLNADLLVFRRHFQLLTANAKLWGRQQGINNMKTFCYDLMLAQLWASKRPSARLQIHDSSIFDGVDERQIAQSLELAHRAAEDNDFQYICALNSDALPNDELSPEFELDDFVRLRVTDESEKGGLLGIRY